MTAPAPQSRGADPLVAEPPTNGGQPAPDWMATADEDLEAEADDQADREPVDEAPTDMIGILEQEARAAGFEMMTPPTGDELRTAAALALETRTNVARREAELSASLTPEQAAMVDMIDNGELLDRLGARLLEGIPTDPPPPLLRERLDAEAHTILYGTGGAGKGTLAAAWIVDLARDGHRVLLADYENHPTEWARRCYGLSGIEPLSSILHVAPLTAAWRGARGPMWTQAADLRELARAFGATIVVVDSIVPACAGIDPLKPEAAALYAGGLEYIGLPVLSLAHVTKEEDLKYPFGSVFWHNLARVTWSLKRDGDRSILQMRKANNHRAAGRFAVTTTWRDDLPREVWEQDYTALLADRIDEILGVDGLAVPELVARLNEDLAEDEERVKPDSVRKALRRGVRDTPSRPARFTVEGTGDQAHYRRIAS